MFWAAIATLTFITSDLGACFARRLSSWRERFKNWTAIGSDTKPFNPLRAVRDAICSGELSLAALQTLGPFASNGWRPALRRQIDRRLALAFDLIVRNGMVADGLGSPLVEADVGVIGGKIAQVGRILERGAEEIDAKGLLVTPGFVDIHTHYDGQATWESRLVPSSWHGVTTVVIGNCGVGFAPVRASDHQTLIELMEGVEDIPGAALHEGLSWAWESFGDYLDALEKRAFDVDVCAQLPHGPLRLYVMGERATRLEDATPEDIAVMRRLAREAAEAGALGFSTSRSINHKSIKGDLTPSYRARADELTGIALGLKDAGRGVLQWISDFLEAERATEYALIRQVVQASGRPMSISVGQAHHQPGAWRETLAMITQAQGEGLSLLAQVAPRPIGVNLGLTASGHPFLKCPSFQPLVGKPLAAQVAAMRDPELRRKLIAEASDGRAERTASRLFPMGVRPDYGRNASASLAAVAEREGRSAEEIAYDLLLEDEGRNLLFYAAVNYADHDFRALREMATHPFTVLGLGDGGAHVAIISDASFQTSALELWVKGAPFGESLDLADVVRRQTSATARAVGLGDRGVVAPGMKADLNIIDLDRLAAERPVIANDLPSGAPRLLQHAKGYVATIVCGAITYRDGVATDALPGRLVRGPQAGPVSPPAAI
jgi:N-acyl-D-aspartate/D-glutamate deacylase